MNKRFDSAYEWFVIFWMSFGIGLGIGKSYPNYCLMIWVLTALIGIGILIWLSYKYRRK